MAQQPTSLPVPTGDPASAGAVAPASVQQRPRPWRRRLNLRRHARWIVLTGFLGMALGAAIGWGAGAWGVQRQHARHQRQVRLLDEAQIHRDSVQQRLGQLDQRVAAAAQALGGRTLEEAITRRADELVRIHDLLAQTRLALAAAVPVENAEAGDAADAPDGGLSDAYLTRLARADADLRELLDARNRERSRLDALRRRMGPSAPDIVAAADTIAQLTDQIGQHVRGVRSVGVEQGGDGAPVGPELPLTAEELAQRQARLTALHTAAAAELEQARQVEASLGPVDVERQRARHDLEAAQRRVDRLAAAAEDTDQAAGALLPLPARSAALGAVLGLLPGLLLVPVVLLLDGRIRRSDGAVLDDPAAPLLGAVPTLPDDEVAADAADLTAMSIHEIRALVQIRAQRDGARAFAITSPSHGAGKTSLTVGLASSLALSGTRTLLVDCDLSGRMVAQRRDMAAEAAEPPRAGVTQHLDQVMLQMGYLDDSDPEIFLLSHDSSAGLTGLLEGEPLEHCTIETSVPGLSILPALAASPEIIGRMSTQFIRRLIDEARASYDLVIFDTGPVPGSVEALLVTSEADATILVVPRGERRSRFERAVSYLRVGGATLAGTVFNRAGHEDLNMPTATPPRRKRGGEEDDLRRRPAVRQITGSGILAAAVHAQASSDIRRPGGRSSREARREAERRRVPPPADGTAAAVADELDADAEADAAVRAAESAADPTPTSSPDADTTAASDADADADDISLADVGSISSVLEQDERDQTVPPKRPGGWRAAAAASTTPPPADAPRTTDPELEHALDELVNDARAAEPLSRTRGRSASGDETP